MEFPHHHYVFDINTCNITNIYLPERPSDHFLFSFIIIKSKNQFEQETREGKVHFVITIFLFSNIGVFFSNWWKSHTLKRRGKKGSTHIEFLFWTEKKNYLVHLSFEILYLLINIIEYNTK